MEVYLHSPPRLHDVVCRGGCTVWYTKSEGAGSDSLLVPPVAADRATSGFVTSINIRAHKNG